MSLSHNITQVSRYGFAIGMVGLGVTSAIWGSFAMQWQPVPASLPVQLSYISNAVVIVAGLGLLHDRTRRWSAALIAFIFALWIVALKLPEAAGLVGKITKVTSWIGFVTPLSEEFAIVAGAWVLFGLQRENLAWRTTWTVARILFGLACVQFGLSHFAFAEFTAGMIPDWIPGRLPLAYLTGAGHLLAGLAVLAGPMLPRLWRVAAGLETLMMTSFVVLVHIPMILGSKPANLQISWTLIFIAILLASSAAAITAQASKAVEDDSTLRGG